MECLEEQTIISEVVLGTTEISKMGELEALAAKRRAEKASIVEVNAITANYNGSRVHAEARAHEYTGIPYCWGGYNGWQDLNDEGQNDYRYKDFRKCIKNGCFLKTLLTIQQK